MRILLVTQWFDPEPTSKGLAFARALRTEGHQVEVVTGFPNYPGGKIYDGYRLRVLQREHIDGVSVIRVPLYPSHDERPLHRVANYVSFGLSSLVVGGFTVTRPDVIYVHHPPLTAGLSAIALGGMLRAPVVYDLQDLWPDTLAATGMVSNERILAVVAKLCSWAYRRSARIVVLSPGFEEVLVNRGVGRDKIRVIMNWCDESQLHLEHDDAVAGRLQVGHRFNVVFAGTMGRAQDLDNVLAAADLLAREAPDTQIVFVGSGIDADRLATKSASMALTNVVFIPRMPMSEVGRVLSAADVLLVHLSDDPLFEITIPGKTQAYMAVGKPILATVRGDAAKLVTESGGGIACAPGDPGALADAIREMAEMSPDELQAMGERGAAYYHDNLALAVGARRFVEVFDEVLR